MASDIVSAIVATYQHEEATNPNPMSYISNVIAVASRSVGVNHTSTHTPAARDRLRQEK